MMTQPRWRARLARRLALDANPLRRRSDRVRAWLGPGAIVGWALLTPVVAAVVGGQVHQAGAQEQLSQRSWRPSAAVLLQRAPGYDVPDMGQVWSWTTAAWTDRGRAHVGLVPALPGTASGKTVRIWLDRAGQPEPPPLSAASIDRRVRLAEFVASLVLGVVLLIGVGLTRFWLTKRNLAGWGQAWSSVEPKWTRRH